MASEQKEPRREEQPPRRAGTQEEREQQPPAPDLSHEGMPGYGQPPEEIRHGQLPEQLPEQKR
jgi:hypothetical protein